MAKGKVTFNEDYCKGCELCVDVCPVHIIKLDKSRINVNGYHPAGTDEPEKCIACASCAIICPDSVIRVERLEDK